MFKKFVLKNIWILVFSFALILLVTHTFNLLDLKVDSTSIVLLILILLSPFVTTIKKLKYGEFEAEINSEEVQKIKKDLEKDAEEKEKKIDESLPIYQEIESILELSKTDKIMALAKIRIELEKLLSKFYSSVSLGKKRMALGILIRELVNLEVLSKKMANSLNEVIAICNRAIHGDYIDEVDSDIVIDLGIDLIDRVYWIIQEQNSNGTVLSEEIIENKEVPYYRDENFYELTSIIPLVDKPKKVIRKVSQEQLNDILENYSEYGEFIISLKIMK